MASGEKNLPAVRGEDAVWRLESGHAVLKTARDRQIDRAHDFSNMGMLICLSVSFLSAVFGQVLIAPIVAAAVLAVLTFVLGTKKSKAEGHPIYNPEVAKAITSGRSDDLIGALVKVGNISETINTHMLFQVWDKAAEIGDHVGAEAQAWMVELVAEAGRDYERRNGRKENKDWVSEIAHIADTFMPFVRPQGSDRRKLSPAEEQLSALEKKLDEILAARKRVEAAASGVDVDQLVDPVGWRFSELLASTDEQAKLLGRVADEYEGRNPDKP